MPPIANLGLTVCRPASATRLGVLAASGEQLEVLVEFFLEAAVAAGEWQALTTALRDKRAARHTVQWYHRMHAIAMQHLEPNLKRPL